MMKKLVTLLCFVISIGISIRIQAFDSSHYWSPLSDTGSVARSIRTPLFVTTPIAPPTPSFAAPDTDNVSVLSSGSTRSAAMRVAALVHTPRAASQQPQLAAYPPTPLILSRESTPSVPAQQSPGGADDEDLADDEDMPAIQRLELLRTEFANKQGISAAAAQRLALLKRFQAIPCPMGMISAADLRFSTIASAEIARLERLLQENGAEERLLAEKVRMQSRFTFSSPIHCPVDDCNKVISNEIILRSHIIRFHLQQGTQCTVCKKNFANVHKYHDHIPDNPACRNGHYTTTTSKFPHLMPHLRALLQNAGFTLRP